MLMKSNKHCDRKLRLARVRGRTGIQVCVTLIAGLFIVNSAQGQEGYGPEVKSFLDLMRHEEGELEFQIKHNEITRKDYIRSKNRIAIHRQTVLNLVKETGEDYVPELHVVAAPELDQLIDDGTAALKGIKRGDVIKQKWRYLGSTTRAEIFYVFERLPQK